VFEEATKKGKPSKGKTTKEGEAGKGRREKEKDMNEIMMSNKQIKLYEKIKYSKTKKETEVRVCCLPFLVLTPLCILMALRLL